jgi:hypothetical protein
MRLFRRGAPAKAKPAEQPAAKPTLTLNDRIRRATERLELERKIAEEHARHQAEAVARAEEARREAAEEQLAESIARGRLWLPPSEGGDVWQSFRPPTWWPRRWKW